MEYNADKEYEKSFQPVANWEKVVFWLLVVMFAIGSCITFSHRIDKTPPKDLTTENYTDYLEVTAGLGSGSTNSIDCFVLFSVKAGYTLSSVQAKVKLSGEYIEFEDSYEFEMENIERNHRQTLRLDQGLSGMSPLEIMEFMTTEIAVEIISVSGRIAYHE